VPDAGGVDTHGHTHHAAVLAQVGDGMLVIGTTPFIGEGFDAPALDTLFLAPADRVRRAAGAVRGAGGSRGAREGSGRGPRLPRPRRASARQRVAAGVCLAIARSVSRAGRDSQRFDPDFLHTAERERGCPVAVRTTGPALAHNCGRGRKGVSPAMMVCSSRLTRHQPGCQSHRLLWLVMEQVSSCPTNRSSDAYAYTNTR
jgi:hypothetical protein